MLADLIAAINIVCYHNFQPSYMSNLLSSFEPYIRMKMHLLNAKYALQFLVFGHHLILRIMTPFRLTDLGILPQ